MFLGRLYWWASLLTDRSGQAGGRGNTHGCGWEVNTHLLWLSGDAQCMGEEEEVEQAINSSPSHLVQMHEGGTGRRVAGLKNNGIFFREE